MKLGIFTKTFHKPTLDEKLVAVTAYGMNAVQFNLSCAGLPSLPDDPEELDAGTCSLIRETFVRHGVTMSAISGTFNMIHPDIAVREDGLRRLDVLAAACRALGTPMITLCTGTRDPDSMWRRHPDNDSAEAWRDLLATMERAVQIAANHHVTMAFEPEVANVVDSARKGRRLLDEIASPHLKVCMDGANIFHRGELLHMYDILDEAFDLLVPDIALAHAKDLIRDGAAGDRAAGSGVLDYDYYLKLLKASGYTGPLIMHSLQENEVARTVAFLRQKLDAGAPAATL
jgi:sugar phosphate isomerase/epimerase